MTKNRRLNQLKVATLSSTAITIFVCLVAAILIHFSGDKHISRSLLNSKSFIANLLIAPFLTNFIAILSIKDFYKKLKIKKIASYIVICAIIYFMIYQAVTPWHQQFFDRSSWSFKESYMLMLALNASIYQTILAILLSIAQRFIAFIIKK